MTRVGEEAPPGGAAFGRQLRLRIEDPIKVPAAVGGERSDPIPADRNQLPEPLGTGRAAGEATSHADDGDRFLVGHLGGDGHAGGGLLGTARQHPLGEKAGERQHLRMVEDDGGRQRKAGGGPQPVAQLYSPQGVEADLLEAAREIDLGGALVAEHRRDLTAHQIERGTLQGLLGEARAPAHLD